MVKIFLIALGAILIGEAVSLVVVYYAFKGYVEIVMGYDDVSFTVNARVSRHNDDRDDRDNELWEKLQEEVTRITAKYVDIDAWVD